MSKHKLLLADDSVTIQKVVNLTFADEGIEVIAVGDGNSAMEKFVEDTPDLVMVDVNMPGVDGYRICEMIKQDEETKHVPVILLVGSFEPFDENEARRVGADDYLTKPFQSIRQLVNKVTVLLNKSNGSEPVAQEQTAEFKAQEVVLQPIERPAPMPPVQEQTADIFEPLGDAGMDDDMIQANQISSLPIDETAKYESGRSDFDTNPLQNQLKNPIFESVNQQPVESSEDFGKTQQYTTAEFEELTATPAEESYQPPPSSPSYSAERVSAEERAMSLEKQMVSEFESDMSQTSSETEAQLNQVQELPIETPLSETFSTEQNFTPEEVPVDNQPPIEEVNQKDQFYNEQSASETETGKVLEELYDAPEIPSAPEPIKQEYYSEPQKVELEEIQEESLYYEPETFSTPDLSQPTSDFETEVPSPVESYDEQFSQPIEESMETPLGSNQISEINSPGITVQGDFRVAETTQNEPETVSGQPTYFQEDVVSDDAAITESDSVETSDETPQFENPVQPYSFEKNAEPEQDLTDLQEVKAEDNQGFESETSTDLHLEAKQNDTETSSDTAFPPFKFTAPEQYFDLKPEAEYDENEGISEPEQESETETASTEFVESENTELNADFESETFEPETFQEDTTSEIEVAETKEFDATENFESENVETEAASETNSVEAELPTETEQYFVAEDSTPTVEIPAAFPTVDDESFPTEEEPVEEEKVEEKAEEKAEVEPKEEKIETQVNTLVSGKEKTDAVESIIVSEFARHSISLSSEAVETIATRIADRISEKIIERMADDVVGSLADRIVEKMERKKLE